MVISMFDTILLLLLSLILIISGIIWIFFQEKYWAYRGKEVKVYLSGQIAGLFQIIIGVVVIILLIRALM